MAGNCPRCFQTASTGGAATTAAKAPDKVRVGEMIGACPRCVGKASDCAAAGAMLCWQHHSAGEVRSAAALNIARIGIWIPLKA